MLTRLLWRWDLRHRTEQLLAGLGSSASEVASRLRGYGVRGMPGSLEECALAIFLQGQIGAEPRVGPVVVMHSSVLIFPERAKNWPVVVGLPRALRRFIEAFDRGIYMDLVSRPSAQPPTRAQETTPG
jgi:hypothetical protein